MILMMIEQYMRVMNPLIESLFAVIVSYTILLVKCRRLHGLWVMVLTGLESSVSPENYCYLLL